MQWVKEQRAVQRAQEEGMGDLQRGTMKGCEDGKQLVKSEYRSQQSMPLLKGKVGFHCWSFIFYACLICFVPLGMEGTKEYLGSVGISELKVTYPPFSPPYLYSTFSVPQEADFMACIHRYPCQMGVTGRRRHGGRKVTLGCWFPWIPHCWATVAPSFGRGYIAINPLRKVSCLGLVFGPPLVSSDLEIVTVCCCC